MEPKWPNQKAVFIVKFLSHSDVNWWYSGQKGDTETHKNLPKIFWAGSCLIMLQLKLHNGLLSRKGFHFFFCLPRLWEANGTGIILWSWAILAFVESHFEYLSPTHNDIKKDCQRKSLLFRKRQFCLFYYYWEMSSHVGRPINGGLHVERVW